MIADDPIETKEKDLLNRHPLAERIALSISRFRGDRSFAVGIEGQWGCGKTSFVNLVLEELRTFPNILTVEFNPWNFSDQDQLVTDLFNSIIDALESDKTIRKSRGEAVRKIKRYFPKLLERGSVNFGVPFLNVDLNLEGLAGNPLEKQKKEIDDLLKEIGKTIVIVVDDIDRLDGRETMLVLKLVKMTAGFANTVFLLAYDRDKVSGLITKQGLPGEEYLKKIVQLGFALPEIAPEDLSRILFDDIDATIRNFDNERWDEVRWGNLFHSGFRELFQTVRDVKRYINSLRLDFEMIGSDEVNAIDFLGVEAVRVFAPKVYSAMAGEKAVLTDYFNSEDAVFTDPPNPSDRSEACEEIIKRESPEGLTDKIEKIVRQLFPQLRSDHSPEVRRGWRKDLRVCSEDIFDKYFSLAVPSTVLSERSLKDFLSTVDDISASVGKLERFEKEGKSRLLLARLFDHLDDLDDSQRENLLVGVFDFAEASKDDHLGAFDVDSVERRAWVLGYQALKRIEKGKQVGFLTKVLDSTKGLFSSVKLVGVLNQEIEERSKGELPEEPLLTKEEVDCLNQACVVKIRNAAEDGSLANTKNLALVLYGWRGWESAEAVRAYAAELLKKKDGLFSLIGGFVSEAHSRTIGDSVPRITRMINRNAIGEFADLDELDRLVHGLDERALSPEKAELLKLYKNSTESF